MKTILVPLGGGDADATVLAAALAAARPLSAHLELMHVQVSAAEAAVHTPHMEFARGSALAGVLGKLASRGLQRAGRAERAARDFCGQHGIALIETPRSAAGMTARWRLDGGEPMQRLLFHARHHDLIVMARPAAPDGLPQDRLESLLIGCGRPLLIAAAAPVRAIDTVMLCWKETRDSARAVTAAMPLLAGASRVVVVGVREGAGAPVEGVDEVAEELAWSGIAAEAHVLARDGRSTADALFAAAETFGADLMVMGAYGHHHMREALFGGCTQSAIEGARRAVLLVH